MKIGGAFFMSTRKRRKLFRAGLPFISRNSSLHPTSKRDVTCPRNFHHIGAAIGRPLHIREGMTS